MEFKGTKGEWVAKNLFNNWLIVDEDTDCVLEIRDNEHNAKLIASAPDLLELCLLVYNSFGGGNVITFSEKDIEDFKQAIEKALK